MPAGGPDRIVIVPGCAATCTYVAWLREQIPAPEHAAGKTATTARAPHARDGSEPDPAA